MSRCAWCAGDAGDRRNSCTDSHKTKAKAKRKQIELHAMRSPCRPLGST